MKRLDGIRPGNDGARSPARSRALAEWSLAELHVERALVSSTTSDLYVVFLIGVAALALRRTLDGRQN